MEVPVPVEPVEGGGSSGDGSSDVFVVVLGVLVGLVVTGIMLGLVYYCYYLGGGQATGSGESVSMDVSAAVTAVVPPPFIEVLPPPYTSTTLPPGYQQGQEVPRRRGRSRSA
jgi:hypothetical protein